MFLQIQNVSACSICEQRHHDETLMDHDDLMCKQVPPNILRKGIAARR